MISHGPLFLVSLFINKLEFGAAFGTRKKRIKPYEMELVCANMIHELDKYFAASPSKTCSN